MDTERFPSRQRPLQDSGRPSSSHSHSSPTFSKSKASTQRSYGTTNSGGSSSSGGSEYDRYHVSNDSLRIFQYSNGENSTEEGWIKVEQVSSEYLEMRRCVNVAMGILGRSRNRAAMSTYSTQLVDAIEAENLPSTAGNELDIYHDDGMHEALSVWLDTMSYEFPEIYISPCTHEYYAITSRLSWGTDHTKHVPQEAAYIQIHHEVSNGQCLFWSALNSTIFLNQVFGRLCMQKEQRVESKIAFSLVDWETKLKKPQGDVEKARQSKNPNPKVIDAAETKFRDGRRDYKEMESQIKNYQVHYERSLFHLGVTLAHECFHVLTGFWAEDFKVGILYKLGGAYASEILKDPKKKRGEAGD